MSPGAAIVACVGIVCATVIIALVLFVAAYRREVGKDE
jgi:heme/copper-type cytochrome/quinol oxidase subunit 2